MLTHNRSIRTLIAAFTALGLASIVSAQTVRTTPVGAVTKAIPTGLSSVGISLVNPDMAVALASANTTSTITLTGIPNAGAALTAGFPFYIEAVSGVLEGERFDVDVVATIASSSSVVTILPSSVNNTLALTTNALVGTQFAIRRHVTLAQVQSFFSSPLVGNASPGSADQIWILNSAGTGFTQYFLRNDLTTWRLTTGTVNVANTVFIPPGTGFIVQKRNTANSLVAVGSVRVNDFSMPLGSGISFRAPAYPVSYSPASLGGTIANGWTGNISPGSADQLRVLNTAGAGFDSYFLRNDGTTWRLSTGTTNVASNLLFNYDSGFLVSRRLSDTNYILVSPVKAALAL